MAGRLLLILPLGPHDGPDGRGREDNEEKIHVHGLDSTSALQTLSNLQLRGLLLQKPGTIWIAAHPARSKRPAMRFDDLENITAVMRQRASRPRPPGF